MKFNFLSHLSTTDSWRAGRPSIRTTQSLMYKISSRNKLHGPRVPVATCEWAFGTICRINCNITTHRRTSWPDVMDMLWWELNTDFRQVHQREIFCTVVKGQRRCNWRRWGFNIPFWIIIIIIVVGRLHLQTTNMTISFNWIAKGRE